MVLLVDGCPERSFGVGCVVDLNVISFSCFFFVDLHRDVIMFFLLTSVLECGLLKYVGARAPRAGIRVAYQGGCERTDDCKFFFEY